MPVTEPRFSFLSTAYRTEDRVSGMIDSVRAQTDPDWELVVVDNGMSDEMARIVRGYADRDPRVRLVRQPNRGLAGGMNTASDHARGRILTLLNSDDRVLPGFCERLGGVLDSRPEVDAVTCDAWFFSATTGERLPRSYRENAGARMPDERRVLTLPELIEAPCPYYTAAVRRAVWEAHGRIDDEYATVGDLLVFVRIVAAGGAIVTVPDRLAEYEQADVSVSRGAEAVLRVEAQREKLLVRVAEEAGRDDVTAALHRELRRSRHRRAVVEARIALLDGDVPEARSQVRRALRYRRDLRTLAIGGGLAVAPQRMRGTYRRRHGLASPPSRIPDPTNAP